jgi:hypothetical protein
MLARDTTARRISRWDQKERGLVKDWLAILTASADDHLDGEEFVVAVPLAARGTIRRSAVASAGLWYLTPKRTNNAVDGETLPKNLVFGLTPTRLFVFELVTKTASLGDVQVVLPLDAVTVVMGKRTKTFMVKTFNIDITLTDDSRLELEAGWPAVTAGEEFVDALAAAIAQREA